MKAFIGVVILVVIVVGIVWYFKFRKPNELEKIRQDKVAKELSLTFVIPEETDVIAKIKGKPNVTVEEAVLYRDGIKK